MGIYAISHVIQTGLLPPGVNLLLIMFGLAFWRRRPQFSKTLLIIAIGSLWLFSTPFIAQRLIDLLQQQYRPWQLEQLTENHSAIVVLGGGASAAPEYKQHFMVSDAALKRLNYAAFLYRHTHLPIIVSGGKLNQTSYTEASIMETILKENFNIPVIWQEDQSSNTADESKCLIPVLKHYKINTILLVTTAWHMPRSVSVFNKTFQETGIKIIPAPTGYITSKFTPAFLYYLPAIDALQTSAIAIHEFIGLIWYRIYYS
jgi:uncharacterized SAM-binding protein YcdF (DUF218 family)